MARDELEFANDPRAAIQRSAPRAAWLLLLVIAAMLVAGFVWASFAEVEQTTRGIGRVIPSRQIQVVESLEPGIVAELFAYEGDIVEKDQILIRLDGASSAGRLAELAQKKAALAAEIARLDAQAAGDEDFVIPDNLPQQEQAFYVDQAALFKAERNELREIQAIRRQEVEQREKSLAEAEAGLARKEESLRFAERELELSRNLFQRRAIPELDFLRIERGVAELRGDIAVARTTRARIEAEIQEARLQIDADRSAFLARVQDRRSKAAAEMAVVDEAIKDARERVERMQLRAPARGIVNKLNVGTIGEVVQAGVSVAEIVPLDDTLLIEAQIRPQDIAFIRPGQEATIRLTAYDYTRYGALPGVVERIGADTITNEDRETFYRIIVATRGSAVEQEQRGISIIPGMVASIDISTGSRTVLEYLIKPVLKLRDQAFRDPR